MTAVVAALEMDTQVLAVESGTIARDTLLSLDGTGDGKRVLGQCCVVHPGTNYRPAGPRQDRGGRRADPHGPAGEAGLCRVRPEQGQRLANCFRG